MPGSGARAFGGLRQHFDPNGHDPAGDEAETAGDADGDIDHAAADEGTAIIDGDHFRLAVGEVDDADLGAHRQRLVGRGGGIVLEALTARGAAAAVAAG